MNDNSGVLIRYVRPKYMHAKDQVRINHIDDINREAVECTYSYKRGMVKAIALADYHKKFLRFARYCPLPIRNEELLFDSRDLYQEAQNTYRGISGWHEAGDKKSYSKAFVEEYLNQMLVNPVRDGCKAFIDVYAMFTEK